MPKHASPSLDDYERQEVVQHHGHVEHPAGRDAGDIREDGQRCGEQRAADAILPGRNGEA
eukprot:11655760-Heterocapsa_arctica.AAC.1